MRHLRPILRDSGPRPSGALTLAGGWTWFERLEVLERGAPPRIVAPHEAPPEILARLTAPRAPVAGLSWDAPRLMGILNATPDSFSDGGDLDGAGALDRALDAMAGVDLIDIGGESTRPGAAPVAPEEEARRVLPVVRAAAARGLVSIDTRHAATARSAIEAGARIVNDVSAMTHDPSMAAVVARARAPVILLHAQGGPRTMQEAPAYGDVLLDVYDHLEARVAAAEAAGIPRERVIVDPGIGFGKTVAHNLALLRGIALFHGLGCPVLLGASRKAFIGRISGAAEPKARGPGTVAVALHAIGQGVQLHRLHDTLTMAQALALWRAIRWEAPS